jgi:ADP-ribose pyrophosphatase
MAEEKKKAAKPRTKVAKKPAVGKTAPKKTAGKKKTAVKKTPVAKKIEGNETAQVLSSEVVYQGPVFNVSHEKVIEPGGHENERDIIHHNGSVVILAVDRKSGKRDPWVVLERQYRHAAGQFLWELPAGKLNEGEDPVEGAKRELAEETGYQAKKWVPLVDYFASPGFLGERMLVFLAEGLVAGPAHPEADEHIEIRLVKLSQIVKRIERGEILDGKTLTSILLLARKLDKKKRK